MPMREARDTRDRIGRADPHRDERLVAAAGRARAVASIDRPTADDILSLDDFVECVDEEVAAAEAAYLQKDGRDAFRRWRSSYALQSAFEALTRGDVSDGRRELTVYDTFA